MLLAISVNPAGGKRTSQAAGMSTNGTLSAQMITASKQMLLTRYSVPEIDGANSSLTRQQEDALCKRSSRQRRHDATNSSRVQSGVRAGPCPPIDSYDRRRETHKLRLISWNRRLHAPWDYLMRFSLIGRYQIGDGQFYKVRICSRQTMHVRIAVSI